MLKNEASIAKVGFDKADNEPSKIIHLKFWHPSDFEKRYYIKVAASHMM